MIITLNAEVCTSIGNALSTVENFIMPRASEKKAGGSTTGDQPELFIQNLGRPIAEDTVPDACIGLRHVEYDLPPQLFRSPQQTFALDTVLYLYWNGPTPEDYLVIDESNVNDLVYLLTMRKESILPAMAKVYCTVEEPAADPVDSNSLTLRIKLNRPGERDPNSEVPGHQGLVVFLPEDIEAGAVVDRERAISGVILEVQPYENMEVYDTCRFAWGKELFTHVVTREEVNRGFQITVPTQVILDAGSDPYLKMAMQVIDAVGNYPIYDPESDANWSPTQTVAVDLGTRPLEAPFIEQPGEIVDLKKLGDKPQKVLLFLHPEVFGKGDRVLLDWAGRDAENIPVPYREEKVVERTNSFMEFNIPNERLKALGGGISFLSCSLQKARTDDWRVSKKVRLNIRGAASPWRTPQVLEASGGYLDPTLAQVTVSMIAPDGWDASVPIRLVWVGRSTIYTQEYTLLTLPEDRILVFRIEGEQIRRFNHQLTELYYERADHASGRASQRLRLQVGEPLGRLPKARVEGSTVEHQVSVVLPFTETVPGDILTLQWSSSQARTSGPTTLTAETAGLALSIPISVENLKDGEIVKVFYSLSRSGQPTRYSELLVWVKGQ
ncbi:hypothetical protein [Pseudomonas carnis]|uniref:hypothetical protein n=1 Tax=Pseudomonas carnis TaxID=2487355 RepID=UPI001BC905AF|nr:hypothetical protein [Pseudomonas carnis]